ncbi:hypothetical protein ES332_D12G065700v1 [Gossypium tomentosum]|uniref:Uncharacterized protein n=1 Tax=Gossypium tomentosum TaxID=34277 RepID=A0A5D2I5E5_GOSTO|nr:hypothetical protein ES332_D12G065700v1 [Gossypium tomentosum]
MSDLFKNHSFNSYTVLPVLASTSAFLLLLVALVDIFIRGEASPDLQTSIES